MGVATFAPPSTRASRAAAAGHSPLTSRRRKADGQADPSRQATAAAAPNVRGACCAPMGPARRGRLEAAMLAFRTFVSLVVAGPRCRPLRELRFDKSDFLEGIQMPYVDDRRVLCCPFCQVNVRTDAFLLSWERAHCTRKRKK